MEEGKIQHVSKDIIVNDLIQIEPDFIPILLDAGMHCLGCPSSYGETLEQACYVHYLDPDSVVEALNDYVDAKNNGEIDGTEFN